MEGHGQEKFRDASLIATSSRRSWTLLSAELRSFCMGEFDAFTPPNAEITQVVADTKGALSARSSGGICSGSPGDARHDMALSGRNPGGSNKAER